MVSENWAVLGLVGGDPQLGLYLPRAGPGAWGDVFGGRGYVL